MNKVPASMRTSVSAAAPAPGRLCSTAGSGPPIPTEETQKLGFELQPSTWCTSGAVKKDRPGRRGVHGQCAGPRGKQQSRGRLREQQQERRTGSKAGSVNGKTCERGGGESSQSRVAQAGTATGLVGPTAASRHPSCPLAQPPPLNWPKRYCLGICPPLLPSCTLSQSSIHSHARPAGAQGRRGSWGGVDE